MYRHRKLNHLLLLYSVSCNHLKLSFQIKYFSHFFKNEEACCNGWHNLQVIRQQSPIEPRNTFLPPCTVKEIYGKFQLTKSLQMHRPSLCSVFSLHQKKIFENLELADVFGQHQVDKPLEKHEQVIFQAKQTCLSTRPCKGTIH